jgi:hypothetical protein
MEVLRKPNMVKTKTDVQSQISKEKNSLQTNLVQKVYLYVTSHSKSLVLHFLQLISIFVY